MRITDKGGSGAGGGGGWDHKSLQSVRGGTGKFHRYTTMIFPSPPPGHELIGALLQHNVILSTNITGCTLFGTKMGFIWKMIRTQTDVMVYLKHCLFSSLRYTSDAKKSVNDWFHKLQSYIYPVSDNLSILNTAYITKS